MVPLQVRFAVFMLEAELPQRILSQPEVENRKFAKTTAVSTHYRRLASFRALVLWNVNANI